jgi:adenylate cyclase
MQIWDEEDETISQFTMSEGLGWAFCAPIRAESCRGWALYVAGRGSRGEGLLVTEDELKGDLRFTELVAQFIGSVRQVRMLQQHKTQLSAFFSPKITESLTSANSKVTLQPADQDITVLFCDLRGFSRRSEQLQDNLLELLQSVSDALGVMAHGILSRDGAIADFQGDSALGFWGWPVSLEDGPLPACRAALSIVREFYKAADEVSSVLHEFSAGMGIAHGSALAGQIGTSAQLKIGVFGPVVNRGSRLEGMTKQFGVPICIDEATANFVQNSLAPSEGRLLILGRVRPVGMDMPLTVSALLPPEEHFRKSPIK